MKDIKRNSELERWYGVTAMCREEEVCACASPTDYLQAELSGPAILISIMNQIF
jgi:hypothetical protein